MASSRLLTLILAATATPLGACDNGFPAVNEIIGFRVLGIRAEPPEVAPGDTVALDALLVDPTTPAGAQPTSIRWYACIVPDQGTGFFGGGSETSTSGGDGTPLATDGYGGSCAKRAEAGEPLTLILGEGPTATLAVPAELFATDAAVKAAYGLSDDISIPAEVMAGFLGIAGVNYTVAMVTVNGGVTVETQKRVNVSLDSPLPDNARNVNPAQPTLVLSLTSDHVTPQPTSPVPSDGRCFVDAGLALTPGEDYTLTPVNVPDPQASYAVLLAGSTTGQAFDIQTLEETYFYSFFSSASGLKKEISKAPGEPNNTWHIPADQTDPIDLWVLVRDGRGGVAWCHETLPVAAAEGAP